MWKEEKKKKKEEVELWQFFILIFWDLGAVIY